jgi:hypothetical protein
VTILFSPSAAQTPSTRIVCGDYVRLAAQSCLRLGIVWTITRQRRSDCGRAASFEHATMVGRHRHALKSQSRRHQRHDAAKQMSRWVMELCLQVCRNKAALSGRPEIGARMIAAIPEMAKTIHCSTKARRI